MLYIKRNKALKAMTESSGEIKLKPVSGALALCFAGALAASLVTLLLVLSFSGKVSSVTGELHDRHYEMLTTAGSLVMLNSRLTMCSSMAALTGEAGFAREHERLAAELNAAVKKINKLTDKPEGSPHAAVINEVNLRLMELESKALRLAGSGKKREASALLTGSGYLGLESTYAGAVNGLVGEFEASLKRDDAAVRLGVLKKSLAITLSGAVTLLFWGLAAFSARRWLRLRGSTEALVAEKEAQFRHFFDTIQEIFYRTDWKGVIVDITPSITKYSGYTREELLGKPVSDLYLNPEDRKPILKELLFKGMVEDREIKLKTKDRGVLDVLVNARLLRGVGGLPAGVEGSLRDITARKAAEEGLRRINRLYSILSLVNESIIHVRSAQKLYEEVCRIAVENGGVKFAWVGLIGPDDQLLPVASFGDSGGYLNDVRVSSDASRPEGRGPTGTAIREKKVIINSDTENNLFMLPWKHAALKRGFMSSATIPVAGIGAITFYAADVGHFAKDEEHLLASLAESITYAVNSLRASSEDKA